jgi:3-oxoacyl-[acyl-carrier protein] reductase
VPGKQKIFLVSGVSSGMGKAFAKFIQAKGHNLIALVRNKTSLVNFNCEQIIELDYAYPDRVEAAFHNFKTKIDCFVNFAAILPGKSYDEYDDKSLAELMNINVISPSLIIKSIVPHIKENGSIILLGSVSAQKGSYDDAYAASKGAIHSLVKSLALKLAPQIRVVGLAPALCNNTRMTQELVPGRYQRNLETIPLKQAAEVEDIAQIAYFLSSDSSKFITGSMLDVNGGQYLR